MMKKTAGITDVLKYLWSVIGWKRWQFRGTVLLRLVTAVVPMALPLYYGQIVDTIASVSGAPAPEMVAGLLGVIWFIILRNAIDWVAWRGLEWNISHMETSTMKRLYDQCYDYLQRHSYEFFANNFAGALVKKVNKLVSAYETLVDVLVFDLVMLLTTIVITLYVVWDTHPSLGLLFSIWIAIFCLIQYSMRRRIMPREVASQEQDSAVTAYLADTVTNHYTVSTFATWRRELAGFARETEKRRQLTFQTRRSRNWIFATNDMTLLIFEVILRYLLITLRGEGMVTVGTILVLQIYVFRLFDKIFMIGNVFKRTFHAIAQGGEMVQILRTPHEIQDITAQSLPLTGGSISFAGVKFGYGEGQSLFSDLNLTIAPGEKVALVGPSGSGKSTIVKLLMRLVDVQGGLICIDGQDITQVSQESLRSAISIVPQDPLLFHRSLRDNIAYGRPDASMEEIIKASRMAHCHEFISVLADGYDTLVGERGIKLSGGERQRVAIARAILEDKKILIMDEATSSLDSESEKLIQDAVHELIKDKTALVIAHRLSTIRQMDRIVVMQSGQIIEQGTHDQLLDTNVGLYHKLWNLQA